MRGYVRIARCGAMFHSELYDGTYQRVGVRCSKRTSGAMFHSVLLESVTTTLEESSSRWGVVVVLSGGECS